MSAQLLSHVPFFVTSWTVACKAPLSMAFSRQEYWSGFPFPPPGDLPNPGIEPTSPASPALQVDSLPRSHLGSPSWLYHNTKQSVCFVWLFFGLFLEVRYLCQECRRVKDEETSLSLWSKYPSWLRLLDSLKLYWRGSFLIFPGIYLPPLACPCLPRQPADLFLPTHQALLVMTSL